MRMEGLILDVSDIVQETKTDRNGEQKQNGKLRLITTNLQTPLKCVCLLSFGKTARLANCSSAVWVLA